LINDAEDELLPPVRVVFYQEGEKVPAQDWIHQLSGDERDACYDRLERLRDSGYELGFPAAEHLGDGIWELRTRVRKVRLRILYFFHERATVVVTHGFHKAGKKVPPIEIGSAKGERVRYQTDPELHAFHWERDNE
jgi:phage-related protein